ncbi:MAG: PEP-utilizing enzyme [Candidatus Paceibacterota bacterium]|jgi:phosphohistidine swiveling domain-containing protein
MKITDIKNDELKYMVERIEPYFASSIIIRGMVDKKNVENILEWRAGVRWLYTNNYFFAKTSDQKIAKEDLQNKFKKGGNIYTGNLIKKCFELGNQLIEVAKSIEVITSKENLATEEMYDCLKRYLDSASNYMIFQNLVLFEDPISELARNTVKKYAKSEKEENELLGLITTASHLTGGEKEQDDFLRLGIKKATDKEIDEHARKYGWLAIRFFVGEPWTKNDVLGRLSRTDSVSAEIELKKRIEYREGIEKKIIKAIDVFSKEDKDIVQLIRDVVYLRTQRTDFFQESSYYVQTLVKEIAINFGVSYYDLLYLSVPEVLQALKDKFNVIGSIEKRKKGFVVFFDYDEDHILEGSEAKKFVDERPILNHRTLEVKELKGSIGYKGKAKGSVCIVKTAHDNSKVKEGDIIVAIMTTPNFIPALEKASAFITDEGGITCHAAIIAREMKKPCIIGTKNATQVLKDGDLVEVDADKGVVRIIK